MTLTPLTFSADCFLVLHGQSGAGIALVHYNPPAKIWTMQPSVEPFDDPKAAIARAIELGVPPLLTTEFWPHGKVLDLATSALVDHGEPVPWTAEGVFAKNSLVTMDGVTWLHISDKQGPPDEVYDLTAGSGDWVPFLVKPEPAPPSPLAVLEARLAALEAR